MREVVHFFKNLFRYDGFRSHWENGSWSGFHGWFYIVSDLLIWSGYFVIPFVIIVYALRKNKTIHFPRLYSIFTAFALLCGAVFLLDALTLWKPLYRLSALLRFCAGVTSWVMVFYVIRNTPKLFSLRSANEMRAEINSRVEVEEELKQKNAQLQEAERLAKLGYIKWDVANEVIEYSDAVHELLEVNRDRKLTYQMLSEIIHPDDLKSLEKVIDTIFIKRFFPNFYCRVNTPVSGIKHLLVIGEVILSPVGTITGVKGTIQDVTEQRLYLYKIQSQNQRLKDIAWIQSHKVRAPVASILGLVQLFNLQQPEDPINSEVLQGISEAAATLDDVIKEINQKTQGEKHAEEEPE